MANYGPLPGRRMRLESLSNRPVALYSGRAVIDRKTIHIHDLTAESEDDLPSALR